MKAIQILSRCISQCFSWFSAIINSDSQVSFAFEVFLSAFFVFITARMLLRPIFGTFSTYVKDVNSSKNNKSSSDSEGQ